MTGAAEELELGARESCRGGLCSWFGFKGGDQSKKVALLSGGERNRVQLAKLATLGRQRAADGRADERPGRRHDALVGGGAPRVCGDVVVVSHDRFFLDRVAWRMLAATRARLDAITPEYISRMPAKYAANRLERGLGAGVPDTELAVECVVGLQAVGDIAPSGWWPAQHHADGDRMEDIEGLDHEAWHDELERRMGAAALRPRGA